MDQSLSPTGETAQLYQNIRDKARAAAGSTDQLRLRARSYLDIYDASGGTCRFALVAAYGALWAYWYLFCGRFAARIFAILDPGSKWMPRTRYRHFRAYVEALKEINALVMTETFVLIHTVKTLGPEAAAKMGFPSDLAADYANAMNARVKDEAALRDLYHRHFLWEQDRVVFTTLEEAFNAFDWPFMRDLCQRPWVWFSYFHIGKSMNFKRFTDPSERIEKGLIAYDRARAFGFEKLFSRTTGRLWLAAKIGL